MELPAFVRSNHVNSINVNISMNGFHPGFRPEDHFDQMSKRS